MMTVLLIISAIVLDYALGEPKRWHPLVAFGNCVKWVEFKAYPLSDSSAKPDSTNQLVHLRFRGVLSVLVLILPAILMAYYLAALVAITYVFDVLVLYLAIGATSLFQHARAVGDAIEHADLDAARRAVAKMVSRDTDSLGESEIAKAAVESTLENGNDAIFAALFWFIIAGAPGVVMYRLVNTLDAMWGYQNRRYQQFGWCAARLDDVLNWLPARLTAISYALAGNFLISVKCWFSQGKLTNSPNAGVVMAAGAGALGIKLGKRAVYDGTNVERPILGAGDEVAVEHIERAVRLVQDALWLWILVLLIITGGYYFA